jgi:hypothetical protein
MPPALLTILAVIVSFRDAAALKSRYTLLSPSAHRPPAGTGRPNITTGLKTADTHAGGNLKIQITSAMTYIRAYISLVIIIILHNAPTTIVFRPEQESAELIEKHRQWSP